MGAHISWGQICSTGTDEQTVLLCIALRPTPPTLEGRARDNALQWRANYKMDLW